MPGSSAAHSRQTAKQMEKLWKLAPFLSVAALLLFWEFGIGLIGVPDYIMPRPSTFLATLAHNWALPEAQGSDTLDLAGHTWATINIIVIGFFAGVIIAIPTGLAIGLVPELERSLYYLIVILNTMPKVALAPLLTVWAGQGALPNIILVAIASFIPVLVDAIAGFKYIDPRVTYLAKSAGASFFQMFIFIRLPSALPHLVSGLRTSLLISIVTAIVIEYVSATQGLGYAAMRGVLNDDISLVFAVITIGTAIGFAATIIMDVVERLLLPWKQARK
ncbi:ABC transporter permease [Breoghania sp.]|uniref:ABC transporter permease n=1 Tax=Breoghania sp. TaxID=2065378 RepID=UPI002AA60CDA|nr:ABC transporter permease [Breoghania sp.]